MKQFLVFVFLILSVTLFSQEKTEANTSFSLRYSINLTHSPKLSSQAIGGDWGFIVDHNFRNRRLGISAGINYSLIHLGFENEFTAPSVAQQFGFLESDFGVFYTPLPNSTALRLKASYIHGLLIENDNSFLDEYNFTKLALGAEYVIPTVSSLALSIGWRIKIFRLDRARIGTQYTQQLFFKVGLSN